MLDALREADREKEPWPTGCLPRAFSDMERVCVGTASSIEAEALLWDRECGLLIGVSRSSSSSSSSPIANAPCSGTFPSDGDRLEAGLRMSSIEAPRVGLVILAMLPLRSLRSWLMRSSSVKAPSTVKSLNASKCLWQRQTISTKRLFASYWWSRMAHIASSSDKSRVWLLSFANRKAGDENEMKRSSSLVHVARCSSCTYGAMLLTMANNAG